MRLRPATFILVASVSGSFGLAGAASRPCALVPADGAFFQAASLPVASLSALPDGGRDEAVRTPLGQ